MNNQNLEVKELKAPTPFENAQDMIDALRAEVLHLRILEEKFFDEYRSGTLSPAQRVSVLDSLRKISYQRSVMNGFILLQPKEE